MSVRVCPWCGQTTRELGTHACDRAAAAARDSIKEFTHDDVEQILRNVVEDGISTVDTLNANIQGLQSPNIADPFAHAVATAHINLARSALATLPTPATVSPREQELETLLTECVAVMGSCSPDSWASVLEQVRGHEQEAERLRTLAPRMFNAWKAAKTALARSAKP